MSKEVIKTAQRGVKNIYRKKLLVQFRKPEKIDDINRRLDDVFTPVQKHIDELEASVKEEVRRADVQRNHFEKIFDSNEKDVKSLNLEIGKLKSFKDAVLNAGFWTRLGYVFGNPIE